MNYSKIHLTPIEKIKYYFFLLIIIYPFIRFSLSFWERLEESSTFTIVNIFIWLGLALYFIYFQNKSLKFKGFRLAHTPQNFKDAAKATAIELNWKIEQLTDQVLVAKKEDIPYQKKGLRITIHREENKIFSNCMVEPSFLSHPFSQKIKEESLRVFNNNLLDATKRVDIVTLAPEKLKQRTFEKENESEWTTKNTLKRILAYISIGLIFYVGVNNLGNQFSPLILLSIGWSLVYLVMDLKAIFKK